MTEEEKIKAAELEAINKAIPADLKSKFIAFFKKFNVAPLPVVPPVAPPPVQLQEAKLKDGTVIKYDTPALTTGSVVVLVTEAGELAVPEGDHILEDGSTIKVVTKDGKSVVEMITPAVVTPPVPDMQAAITAMRSEFAAQAQAREVKITELEGKLTAMDTQFREFTQLFEQVISTPSEGPITPPKNKNLNKEGINAYINR